MVVAVVVMVDVSVVMASAAAVSLIKPSANEQYESFPSPWHVGFI